MPIKASSALEEAELAEAGKYAPYHYTRAVEYLRKAREEVADADYQAANRFGRKSEEAARRARELSLQRAASGEDGAVGPPESAPPVKDESGDEVPPGLGGSRGEP